jgi:hypothetical protein
VSRLPHFLDKRLTDGGEVVSYTRRPLFTPRKIPSFFCQTLRRSQGHSAVGNNKSIEESGALIGKRTHNSPACSILPQPTMLPCADCAHGKICISVV